MIGASIHYRPVLGLGEIKPGDDLATLLAAALPQPVGDGDVLVVAQKIVSKAEGRYVDLATVTPSPRAQELAATTQKDPRLVELILAESTAVLRAARNVLIVRHRSGHVMANSGIDRSNVPSAAGREMVLLLPLDADASADRLRANLNARLGVTLALVISDSFGRPWRMGTVNVALGAAGLPAIIDRRGEVDRNGRTLEVTQVALADAVAGAAGLVMGEGAEGTPAVLVQGLTWQAPERPAAALLRPLDEDLFR